MVKKINFCIILCLLFFIPVFLPAQTAAELDEMLESSKVTYSQAARFVLASVESASVEAASDGDESEDPLEQAINRKWLPRSARSRADRPINMGSLSLLMMKAFDLKGGLFYLIFPGPRYAYRAMKSNSFIQGAADPAMTVSGERFLLILGNVLNTVEEQL